VPGIWAFLLPINTHPFSSSGKRVVSVRMYVDGFYTGTLLIYIPISLGSIKYATSTSERAKIICRA